MQTAAAVVATSYGSRRALPRTRSDGLLCLSGSYSRLLQGQKLPTGLRVLSVRFARSRPESRPAAFGQLPSCRLRAHSRHSRCLMLLPKPDLCSGSGLPLRDTLLEYATSSGGGCFCPNRTYRRRVRAARRRRGQAPWSRENGRMRMRLRVAA